MHARFGGGADGKGLATVPRRQPTLHFHRNWVYIALDALVESREVKYVGSSVTSAEEWHLRQRCQPIAQDVFGEDARLKNGQVLKFGETAVRILADAGWQPGAISGGERAVQILRDHMAELASCIQIKASRQAAEQIAIDEQRRTDDVELKR